MEQKCGLVPISLLCKLEKVYTLTARKRTIIAGIAHKTWNRSTVLNSRTNRSWSWLFVPLLFYVPSDTISWRYERLVARQHQRQTVWLDGACLDVIAVSGNVIWQWLKFMKAKASLIHSKMLVNTRERGLLACQWQASAAWPRWIPTPLATNVTATCVRQQLSVAGQGKWLHCWRVIFKTQVEVRRLQQHNTVLSLSLGTAAPQPYPYAAWCTLLATNQWRQLSSCCSDLDSEKHSVKLKITVTWHHPQNHHIPLTATTAAAVAATTARVAKVNFSPKMILFSGNT